MTIFTQRQKRAAALMIDAKIAAAAFVPGPNFSYLTGVDLHLMERPTLYVQTASGSQYAVMPALEKQKWSESMPGTETYYWADEDGPKEAFAALASALGPVTLGVEGLRMRAAELMALRQYWPQDAIVDADQALVPLRICKDADEIADLRRAITISETALGETLDSVKAGHTEAEVAARLKQTMLAHGAQGFAFDPIVLAGAQAANPHGHPGERKINAGDVILIDFGASYGVMNADITRTVFCEHARDEHAAIYQVVKNANEAGKAATAPGVATELVDKAATKVLVDSDYGDLILHKTGHGLGREVHEAPQVMRGNTLALAAGMVITVEPGLYRAGDIGVRVEDDVMVTDAGHESLTTYSRELQIVG